MWGCGRRSSPEAPETDRTRRPQRLQVRKEHGHRRETRNTIQTGNVVKTQEKKNENTKTKKYINKDRWKANKDTKEKTTLQVKKKTKCSHLPLQKHTEERPVCEVRRMKRWREEREGALTWLHLNPGEGRFRAGKCVICDVGCGRV